jgi:hypothetical protein
VDGAVWWASSTLAETPLAQFESTKPETDESAPANSSTSGRTCHLKACARGPLCPPPLPAVSSYPAVMASSTPCKLSKGIGMHQHGQDSAIHLQDAAEPSHTAETAPAYQASAQHSEDTLVDAADGHDLTSDSGFDSGSLLGDETDSLASSILNHRMENGRQYHAYRDGAYWGPNDELAKEILDFAHHMYLLTLDQKLHLAPIQNPQAILDCGTGTGIWAIVGNRAPVEGSPH